MADQSLSHAVAVQANVRAALACAKSDFECQNSDFEPHEKLPPSVDSDVCSTGCGENGDFRAPADGRRWAGRPDRPPVERSAEDTPAHAPSAAVAAAKSDFECQNSDFEPHEKLPRSADSNALSMG